MQAPSPMRLLRIFLRIGNLTFGGGDPTMAALYSELVVTRRWLAPERYGLIYALARITPGTNMLAFCAAAAWEILGWPAAVLGVFAATVPSAVVVVLLTAGYTSLTASPAAMAAIAGTLAAAVGMMAAGAWLLLGPHLGRGRRLRALTLATAAFALVWWVKWSPIAVLGLAALAGAFWSAPENE